MIRICFATGEEATEIVIAAKNDSGEEIRAETADLLFHLLVLFRARNLPLSEVWKELERRFGQTPKIRTKPEGRGSAEP